jgi:hypothetical protein
MKQTKIQQAEAARDAAYAEYQRIACATSSTDAPSEDSAITRVQRAYAEFQKADASYQQAREAN